MNLVSSPRHRRRGYFRGDFLAERGSADAHCSGDDAYRSGDAMRRPVAIESPVRELYVTPLPPPPPAPKPLALAPFPPQAPAQAPAPVPVPRPTPVPAQPIGTWLTSLADLITDQARTIVQQEPLEMDFTPLSTERIMQTLTERMLSEPKEKESNVPLVLLENLKAALQQMESGDADADLYLDSELASAEDESLISFETDLDLSFGLTEDEPADSDLQDAGVEEALSARWGMMFSPHVEMAANGCRIETFDVGSTVLKDALGRVIEVQSAFGDLLSVRYGHFGRVESVLRADSKGRAHSEGSLDSHGVVIRDAHGRAMAAGDGMTVDPHGRFFLHALDGQFFSIDLVSGVHIERRKVEDADGSQRYITGVFAYDGFRMATVYGRIRSGGTTGSGAGGERPRYRFYGRDGTFIEFPSESDLQQLRPSIVMPPASRPICPTWRAQRQAGTAWQSVQEYLMRVS